MHALRERLHDARLAVERWLLVTMFGHLPELVDALMDADRTRLEFARLLDVHEERVFIDALVNASHTTSGHALLLGAIARERLFIARRAPNLQATIANGARAVDVIRTWRSDASSGLSPVQVADLRRVEHDVTKSVLLARMLLDALQAETTHLDIAERYTGGAVESQLH